ncbi:MAG: tandem-95 repeat protein [Verrucomicrobiaceae bacterium]|nr:tandem-95 repeat protein [Verrucomicrobiaceae bacterium]
MKRFFGSILCVLLGLSVILGIPVFGETIKDPDSVEWASVCNYTSQEFATDLKYRQSSYILVDIEVDEIDGQQRISGVWQRNLDGRQWAERHNLTDKEFADYWVNYQQAGYRLIDQESYVLGGERYYAGIWMGNVEGYQWASYRNLSDSSFSEKMEQHEDTHLLVDFEAYAMGDSIHYAGIWVENTGDIDWLLRRDRTDSQFTEDFQVYKGEYRIHDFESYQVEGEERYAAIWIKNSNGRWWSEHRDMTAKEYRNQWLRHRDMGYRLSDFEQYETGSGIRYAGVWRQNSDRPDWTLRSSVDELAEEFLENKGESGLGVAVVHQGEILYKRGFGCQDDAGIWYSAQTLNRLGSISKSVGGVLLYCLDELDQIDPSLPTSSYVEGLPSHHTHNVAQLASNRGGAGHYDEHGLGNVSTQYDTAVEAAGLFWDDPLVSTPGTAYKYSTHGYTLLGAAIEGVAGTPISEVIDNLIGSGLGLSTLRAEDRSVEDEFRSEVFHNNSVVTADNISWKLLGGGMESSVEEMALFCGKLMAGEILSPASLDALWMKPDNLQHYAMGWDSLRLWNNLTVPSVMKTGLQLGANTHVRLFPSLELGIVVFSNMRQKGDASSLTLDIAKEILPAFSAEPDEGESNGEFITQYRYRPFDGEEPKDWISSYVDSKTKLPAVVKEENGEGRSKSGDAFQDFWYGDFDGTRRYVCADDVADNDLSGAVSVQAFFCLPSISSSIQTICSTVSEQTGFRLYIDNGILKGGCYYQNPQGSEVTVAAPEALEKDVWYHVAFVARRGHADGNELHLWVNSQKVASNYQTPATRAIDNSTLNPVFGAERSGNGFKDYLEAKVHAIEVNDYALSDFYLETKVIRDGSRYFGIPSYHDYLNNSDAFDDRTPLEKRIMDTYRQGNLANFRSRLQDRFFLPFMNDNYIPQGVATDPENDRMFIAYYYKDKDNNTDHASIVAEILMPSATLGNVFILDEKDAEDGRLDDDGKDKWSHVGGIAYWEGYLFVPDSKDLLVYDISNIEPSGFDPLKMTGFNPVTIDRVVRFKNQVPWNSIAFIDIHEEAVTGKPIIALGDYTASGDFSNPKPFNDSGEFLNREGAQELAAIDLYYLKKTLLKNGDWEIELSPKKETLNEAYLYTQGVKTYFDSEIGRRLFYSVTGNKPKEVYKPAKIYHATYEWFDDHGHWPNALTRELVCYTPRGNEDLALYDGKLWTVSESGAKHFQKKADVNASGDPDDEPDGERTHKNDPWEEVFPFLFSISVDDYFEAIPNEAPILEDRQWRIPENSQSGTSVRLSAIDANRDFLTYGISGKVDPNGNGLLAFRIDGDELVVSDPTDLDHEANGELTVQVFVNDGQLTDSATITVLLLDDRNEDADGDGLTEAEEEDTHGTSDHNADSDGDGFADGVEVAANTNPADAMSRPPLADSVADFSGVQGQGGWYYGYRNYTQDGGGDDYDADNDFVAFDAGDWTGSKWDLGGGAPWTELGPNYTHPNGTNSAPQEEHWTVRRWVTGELSGTTPVAITWSARKINSNNNGVTGSLHINGMMVDSKVVGGDDQVGEVRTFYANLLPGDIVDLALSPVGTVDRFDGNDSSRNWFSVSDAVPEDPVQPDGTPFVPFVIAPVAANDSFVTLEDTEVMFNVLANDRDPDGQNLSVQLISGPGFGAVTARGKGSFTYTPAADFNGTDTLRYVVTDSSGATDTATVTITVTSVNDAPVANNDVLVTLEDRLATFNVLLNDTDVDGDGLIVQSMSEPGFGAVTALGKGVFTYTSATDFNGTDTLRYVVTDSSGATDTATVTITVTAVNDAPVANNEVLVTAEDNMLVFNVLDNDTDVDGDELAVQSTTVATSGTVRGFGGGVFTYRPDAHFHGTDTFSYVVEDPSGVTDTATVTITVTSVNDTPEAGAVAAAGSIPGGESSLLGFNLVWQSSSSERTITGAVGLPPGSVANPPNINAPGGMEGGTLSLTVEGVTTTHDDPGIIFVANQELDFSRELIGQPGFGPNAGPNGNRSGYFNAYNNGVINGVFNFKMMLVATDERYDLVSMATMREVITGHLGATDADEGDSLSYSLEAPVAGLTINADGSYSFELTDPAYQSLLDGQTQEVVANWAVTDDHGASASNTLTITVTGSAPWPPLRITSVVGDGAPSELTALRISFVSRTGKVYAVERSRDLVGWEVLANVDGEEDSTEYTDTNPILDGSAVFYRVREVE